MTAGSRTNSSQSPGRRVTRSRLARLVSQEALPTLTQDDDGKRSPQYVSSCEDDDGQMLLEKGLENERSGSPMRCVSEFDEVMAVGKENSQELEETGNAETEDDQKEGSSSSSNQVPPLPNPLHNARLRSTHVRALRLEAELQPMRMILGRLMAHPTNKKGLFNAPVNAIALGLIDYHQIIKRPMDLGTIKSMLYSIAYQSRQQVADDIRLVFENAMLYNPPKNVVHMAAKSLQDFFEELYAAVGGDKKTPTSCATRHVSFAQEQAASIQESMPQPLEMGITRTVSSTEADLMSTTSTTSSEQESTIASTTEASSINGPSDVPAPSTTLPANSGACIDPNQFSSDLYNPQSTRAKASPVALLPPMEIKHQRRRRLSLAGNRKTQGHSCRSCLGRTCLLCEQSCLALEPTLLVCNGGNCAGARIRKGSTYFIAPDGSRQYCQRCFACLPPVLSLSASDNEDIVRYKRDLLKRKNDEELVEDWLTCSKCEMGVHRICALHNSYANPSEDYTCPSCVAPSPLPMKVSGKANTAARHSSTDSDVYTFVTGAGCPLRLSDVADPSFRLGEDVLSADSLPKTDISNFVEEKVRDRLRTSCDLPNVDKTITVRMISDCHRSFKVPDVVRKHFRMPTEEDSATALSPPERVNYKSKAIALFQKVDGLDVCIFCMYVQEYSGNDDYEDGEAPAGLRQSKRVYVAYLDSVEHFRPRSMRTNVYHEVLVAYLASARQRGFQTAHIWACPPSRGNSFVFWNHPASQRTPTKDRLISWYHGALSRALDCGVLTDVKSLYESDFDGALNGKGSDKENEEPLHPSGRMVCPPLLEGDFWIEEAVRIHGASLARHLKAKSANEGKPAESLPAESAFDPCPARQVGSLLIDRLMAHSSCAPFRRPVNAAALKLKDYHKIVTKPMDLGTIYSLCIHGEYSCLGDLVADVELVFANAKKFNPAGHAVHNMAIEMEELFFKELNMVVEKWDQKDHESAKHWKNFLSMSMSLDMKVEGVSDAVDSSSMDVAESSANLDESDQGVAPAASHSVVVESGCPVEKLLVGGPDALSQRMVGDDKWMMEKKNPCPKKRPSVSKKGGGKRRRVSTTTSAPVEEESCTKRRRQSWLGEEVGASVRAMRTSFFACSLVPKQSSSEKIHEKSRSFAKYTDGFDFSETSEKVTSRVADARSSLLEFSQRRNLEFSTLRHAKYSTAVLLYHLHHPDAPGMVPVCTSCDAVTTDCRWHKIVHVQELKKAANRRPSKVASNTKGDAESAVEEHDTAKNVAEDLCTACLAKHPQKDLFIPLQVAYNPAS